MKHLLNRLRRAISCGELKRKEEELADLRRRMLELQHWCAHDSPDIGHAIIFLNRNDQRIDAFRDVIRRGTSKETFLKAL